MKKNITITTSIELELIRKLSKREIEEFLPVNYRDSEIWVDQNKILYEIINSEAIRITVDPDTRIR